MASSRSLSAPSATSITKEVHRLREAGYNVDTIDREHGIAQYRISVAA
jgi:biotin operon repressor